LMMKAGSRAVAAAMLQMIWGIQHIPGLCTCNISRGRVVVAALGIAICWPTAR
jgi:hypothetical protein